MGNIGCFMVGLCLFVVAIIVMIALSWILGLPAYRLSSGHWPWQSNYMCVDEVCLKGFMTVAVLVAVGGIFYPFGQMLVDLGCWALKVAR